ncbi:SDR family oxidoreductase [Massilia sp. W12]|uniref:SDR family oxidoreductase n=1 Tax=Massilia sp. W12 TaxID=3126507 RepID=UPI0030D15A85
MRILLTGASGFIGRHVLHALTQQGHQVLAISRRAPQALPGTDPACWRWQAGDLQQMQAPADWAALLQEVDVVINSVGIIRETRAGDFQALHSNAPRALFAAAQAAGVAQVIQISAQGSAPDAATGYWRSKGEAESALQTSSLHYTILRPGLVYGDDGDSSRMFMQLASLPCAMLPGAASTQVQPVHIDDLCACILRLLQAPQAAPRRLEVLGPRRMLLRDYLNNLRQGMGALPGLILSMPFALARPLAWAAERFTSAPLTPDALVMLQQGERSCGDPAPLAAWLGRSLRDPANFAHPALLLPAVWGWAGLLLRVLLAVLWLWTAWTSWFGWPQAQSHAWLQAIGIPAALAPTALAAACLMDAAIGLLLLWRPARWLWWLQLGLVGFYSLALAIGLPDMLFHPFGPLSKNLPILGLLLLFLCLQQPGRK